VLTLQELAYNLMPDSSKLLLGTKAANWTSTRGDPHVGKVRLLSRKYSARRTSRGCLDTSQRQQLNFLVLQQTADAQLPCWDFQVSPASSTQAMARHAQQLLWLWMLCVDRSSAWTDACKKNAS
jgi:hypothetical protein